MPIPVARPFLLLCRDIIDVTAPVERPKRWKPNLDGLAIEPLKARDRYGFREMGDCVETRT